MLQSETADNKRIAKIAEKRFIQRLKIIQVYRGVELVLFVAMPSTSKAAKGQPINLSKLK